MNRKRTELVMAIYLQTRGFAFVLLETWRAPVDWAVQDVRGADKNANCLKRVDAIFALHTPDVVVLQEMPKGGTSRALRVRRLNHAITKLAERRGISVRMYRRSELRESFAYHYGATTNQRIAETIASQIPTLNLYVPPARKPWMGEHGHMGIFKAAALAWIYLHIDGRQQQAA
jgi:exonuclease III